jgi:Tetratricopeptide repeat
VNKDNLLFAMIGLLFGFIAGYLLHEVLVARQPLRRPASEMAADAGAGAGGGMAEPPAAGGSPQADMAPNGGAGAADAGGGAGQGAGAPGFAAPEAPAAGGPAGAAAAGGGAGAAGLPPGMAAVQQLRDYVASHPKDADAVLKLANLNFDIHNWARARDLYSQYLGLRPDNPDVMTDLGDCYRELKQYDSALAQFRRAEGLAPAHWRSLFNEVVVLAFDLKQFDAADKAFAHLQQVAPQQPEVTQLGTELQRRRAAG